MIVVEDIIDTGLTLNYLLRYLADKGPASIRICCLLDKPARRLAEIPIDYRGFTIPDRFVIGYGLDYDERYRNLPYIGVLKPSVYGGAPARGLARMPTAGGGRFRFLILLGSAGHDRLRLPAVVAGRRRDRRRASRCRPAGDRPRGSGDRHLRRGDPARWCCSTSATCAADGASSSTRRGSTSLLGLVGAAALAYRGWELWSVGYLPLPQQSPGLALAAVGVGARPVRGRNRVRGRATGTDAVRPGRISGRSRIQPTTTATAGRPGSASDAGRAGSRRATAGAAAGRRTRRAQISPR